MNASRFSSLFLFFLSFSVVLFCPLAYLVYSLVFLATEFTKLKCVVFVDGNFANFKIHVTLIYWYVSFFWILRRQKKELEKSAVILNLVRNDFSNFLMLNSSTRKKNSCYRRINEMKIKIERCLDIHWSRQKVCFTVLFWLICVIEKKIVDGNFMLF